jgi:hypothetical protein
MSASSVAIAAMILAMDALKPACLLAPSSITTLAIAGL